MQKELKCPCCESVLVVTHQDRYESLDEHVSNPNGTPSLKDGYQCLNHFCAANNIQAVWTEDGEMYTPSLPEGITSTVAHKMVKSTSKTGFSNAINSWSENWEMLKEKEKRGTRKITLLSKRYVFIPIYEGDDRVHKLKRIKVEVWKKEDNGWVHHHPFIPMFKYKIKDFKRNLKMSRKGDMNATQACIEHIQSRTRWGTEDSRMHARAFSWAVNLLYPNVCKEVFRRWMDDEDRKKTNNSRR